MHTNEQLKMNGHTSLPLHHDDLCHVGVSDNLILQVHCLKHHLTTMFQQCRLHRVILFQSNLSVRQVWATGFVHCSRQCLDCSQKESGVLQLLLLLLLLRLETVDQKRDIALIRYTTNVEIFRWTLVCRWRWLGQWA